MAREASSALAWPLSLGTFPHVFSYSASPGKGPEPARSERSEHRSIDFPSCSPILYRTPAPSLPMKLSRKALEQAAKETPIEHILGRQVSGALTPKQRKFAHEVAKGSTKADAYRAAYDVTSQRTLNVEPYMLARDPRITREIEAYTLAIEAEKHRTPAALRSLVIQGLVQVALNEDTKDSVRVQALKTLGTVTEVAAFTERKEVRTISSSEDARARVMQELRGLISAGATDATIIEADADSLLAELSVKFNGDTSTSTSEPDGADPPTGHPPDTAAKVPRT
jgi:phage terminase small subunit